MSTYNAEEAAKFFRSYGAKCDENEIKEWMKSTPTLSRGYQVDEWDLYAFNDWMKCKGTSNEPGIDNETKVARMIGEIKELKEQNRALKKEVYKLKTEPGILPL
ncbi:hypothetical protein [Bacillus sp. B15-48]|uniref:hypothetical protein n=1 Tax=Bacillus sp. B15-48 TaxID=1548601 RepID=UPI00193EF66B|nr:hypothetical protein [Bacillus sp. B15-48]MBM4764791.1 hypothetical protein [Bacillus sp. B15-48]